MGGATKILGIDPGLQRCGWGVLVADGPRLSYLAHGVIKPRTDQSLAERLAALAAGIEAVVADLAPDEAAVEETFVNSNARAALTLGQARGAAMAAAARTGLPVAEYAPSVIKKAVVGSGAADKSQIAFMGEGRDESVAKDAAAPIVGFYMQMATLMSSPFSSPEGSSPE